MKLGSENQKLTPCPTSPNSVASDATDSGQQGMIE